jgi:hypothetical protein
VDTVNPTQNQARDLDLSPAELLRGAAVYVARHGFHQGDMFAADTDPFPAACAQGAVKMAICGRPYAAYTREQGLLFDRAMNALVAYLDTRFNLLPVDDENTDEFADPFQTVADWNDETGRTAAQLVTALNGAADEWEFFHQICTGRDAMSGGAK